MSENMKSAASLEDRGIIYIGSTIDDGTSEEVCKKIIEMNLKQLDCIQMIINSPGGSVTDGFAIIDMMEWSKLPIRTTGIGSIASMGLLIFMAGAKGSRVVTPRCSILSHRFSWWSSGKHSDMIAQRKEEDMTHKKILEHYKRYTKFKNDKDIHKYLLPETDMWLSAEEAVRFGIADKIEGKK